MRLATLVKPHPALRILAFLQLRGAFRSLFRRVPTVEGLYALAITGAFIAPFIVDRENSIHWGKQNLFLFGSPALGLILLYGLRAGLNGTAIYFSKAETTFLLAAPFPKESLLGYKFQQYNATAIVAVLLLAAHFSKTLPDYVTLASKFYLTLFFLFTFPIVVSSFVPRRAGRVVAGLKFFANSLWGVYLATAVLGLVCRLAGRQTLAAFFHRGYFTMSQPFAWAYHAIGLEIYGFWPVILGLCVADLILVALLVARSRYLDIESIIYKDLSRSAQPSRWSNGSLFFRADSTRLLPQFPGGAGPLLIVKAHELVRWRWSLLLIVTLFGMGFTSLTVFLLKASVVNTRDGLLPWHLIHIVEVIGLIITVFLAHYDFRFLTQRIEFFKTLPLSPWKIFLSEGLPSTVFLYGFLGILSTVGLSLFQRYVPEMNPIAWLPGALLFLLPATICFLLVGNLCFLMFPARLRQAGSPIVQMILPLLALIGCVLGLVFLTSWGHTWVYESSLNTAFPMAVFSVLSFVGFSLFAVLLVWLGRRQF